MASKFITAVSKTTKRKQRIPAAWLDHPKLGQDFELPPSARATASDTPPDPGTPPSDQDHPQLPVDEDSSIEELLQYAADNEIDLGDAQNEAEVLAVIRTHHESPSSGEKE